jgi:predicted transcriptional regulator
MGKTNIQRSKTTHQRNNQQHCPSYDDEFLPRYKMNKIYIVESHEIFDKEMQRRLQSGELQKKPFIGIVMTVDLFAKMFTPERIRLLQRIRRNRIQNIYQLAKEMNKPYEVVFRNIKFLEEQELIQVITKNRKKIPVLGHDFSVEFFSGVAEA